MLGSEKLLILPFETDFMKTVSKDKLRRHNSKEYIFILCIFLCLCVMMIARSSCLTCMRIGESTSDFPSRSLNPLLVISLPTFPRVSTKTSN